MIKKGVLGALSVDSEKMALINKFTKQLPQYFTVADGIVQANGVIFELDTNTNKPISITRIQF